LGTKIVGLLPMGGEGARLGLPFPKPLAPTFVTGGMMPLYAHALHQLREVTSDVSAIVNMRTCNCLLRSLDSEGIGTIEAEEPSLPGALAIAAKIISVESGPDTLIAVALPDSIWKLVAGCTMQRVVDKVRGDGALALFSAGADELDSVVLEGPKVVSVKTKVADFGMVQGWGAFVIRAEAMANFNSVEKDGPQLGRLDMGWAFLGDYVDLGTPERYMKWHDTRSWNAG
jgi:hypothetical protein